MAEPWPLHVTPTGWWEVRYGDGPNDVVSFPPEREREARMTHAALATSAPEPREAKMSLVEEAAASMYGKNWNSPEADKRPGEKMKDVWRGYAKDALVPILPRLSALREENKRLREALEPFAARWPMGDNYVRFAPRLLEAARVVLACEPIRQGESHD